MTRDGSSQDLKSETTIGSYRLIRPLGSGGMSSVYLAVHVETGVEVAIKILPRSLAKNPILLQRFLREAKSAEALEHPSVVAIYDRGRDQGRYYLILEYVAGGDLSDWVRANGPMSEREAIASIKGVAEGLRYAASRGVIHRDIKPANLLREPDGRIKIADLGLAVRAESEDERVTREGTTVGTVDYMAPEQARDSRATTVRSDIYSLGCTFYFLLTGQPPFPTGNILEKLTKHCTVTPKDPRELRPEVSAEVSKLVLRMLEKRQENRFENYEKLLSQLHSLEVGSLTYPVLPAPTGRTAEFPNRATQAIDEDAASGSIELDGPEVSDDYQSLALLQDEESRPDASLSLSEKTPVEGFGEAISPSRSSRMTEAERTWLVRCVFLGAALVVMVIAGDQILRRGSNPRLEVPVVVDEPNPILADAKPEVHSMEPTEKSRPEANGTTEQVSTVVVDSGARSVGNRVGTAIVPVRERSQLASVLPNWALASPTERSGTRIDRIVRVELGSDGDLGVRTSTPGFATQDVVEFGDVGPYFFEKLAVGSGSGIYRSGRGVRALIQFRAASANVSSGNTPIFRVKNQSISFEDLDFVVDLKDFARDLVTLVEIAGGEVSFRRCTLTVVNRGNRRTTLLQSAPSPQASRILFEDSFVRGASPAFLDLARGETEFVILRSVFLNGSGTAIVAGESTNGSFVDSFIATRESNIRFEAASDGRGLRPSRMRSLGTTFAKLTSPNSSSFLNWDGQGVESSGEVAARLDWRGEENVYLGWKRWSDGGGSSGMTIRGLVDARATWQGSDAKSVEREVGITIPTSTDEMTPQQLGEITQHASPILTHVPAMNAFVLAKTVDGFARPVVSGLTSADGTPLPLPRKRKSSVSGTSGNRAQVVLNEIDPARQADEGGQNRGQALKSTARAMRAGERSMMLDLADPRWGGRRRTVSPGGGDCRGSARAVEGRWDGVAKVVARGAPARGLAGNRRGNDSRGRHADLDGGRGRGGCGMGRVERRVAIARECAMGWVRFLGLHELDSGARRSSCAQELQVRDQKFNRSRDRATGRVRG